MDAEVKTYKETVQELKEPADTKQEELDIGSQTHEIKKPPAKILPAEKTPPMDNLQGLTMLLHGPPKIGKSTWCSQADGVLFLATEPGLNSLETYQKPILSWMDFLDVCGALQREKHSYKTVTVDTVDNAWLFCSEHICGKAGVEHESDLGWGKGWAAVKREFHRVITKLAQMETGLILVSHSKYITIEGRTNEYQKAVPTLSQGGRDVLLSMADMILFCDIVHDEDEDGRPISRRVMHTKPSLYYEAGDRTGRLPETIDLSYLAFLEAFNAGKKGTDE